MVKSEGEQRESDGVVVPVRGSQPRVGKGPDFGHAGEAGKRKGMAGAARSNYPDPIPRIDNVRRLQRKLWAAAKQSPGRRFHALFDRICRGDVLVEARRVADNIAVARQQSAAMPTSIEQLAGEGGAETLVEMAQRSALARPTRGMSQSGVGPSPLDQATDFAAHSARRHVDTAMVEAAPALLDDADRQWRAVHQAAAQLPEPVSEPIDPGTVSPEQWAALGEAANVAARARVIRRLRDAVAQMLGERRSQVDEWSTLYSLPPDPTTALNVLEQQLWDPRYGVSDDPAVWRAVRAGAQPSLCLEAEARRRSEALRGERNRRGVLAAEGARKRAGQPSLLVNERGQEVMRRFAQAEIQRLAENGPTARQG